MFSVWERFQGKTDVGDIDTKDNKVVDIAFFVGFAITLMVVVWLFMLAFL